MAVETYLREITSLEERVIEELRYRRRDIETAERLDMSMAELREHVAGLLKDLGLVDRDALIAWRERYGPPPLVVRVAYHRRRLSFGVGERARRWLNNFG